MARRVRLLAVACLIPLLPALTGQADAQPSQPAPPVSTIPEPPWPDHPDMHLESAAGASVNYARSPQIIGYGVTLQLSFMVEELVLSFTARADWGNKRIHHHGSGALNFSFDHTFLVGYRLQFGAPAAAGPALDILLGPSLLLDDDRIYTDDDDAGFSAAVGAGAYLRLSSHASRVRSPVEQVKRYARSGYFVQLGAELFPSRRSAQKLQRPAVEISFALGTNVRFF
jgi:hypothetical protein